MLIPKFEIGHYAKIAARGEWFPWQESYEILLYNIRERKGFTFARYGDGEWSAILGVKGVNCDGHKYYEEMGRSLSMILAKWPKYIMGAQSWCLNPAGDFKNGEVVKFLNDRGLIERKWANGDVLHSASVGCQLHRFVEVLAGRDVVIVGKAALARLPFAHVLVEVPEHDAWSARLHVLDKLSKVVRNRMDVPIILYSCSMMAEWMMDIMYHSFGGSMVQLDMGSVWDPYLGLETRRYHKTMDVGPEDLIG